MNKIIATTTLGMLLFASTPTVFGSAYNYHNYLRSNQSYNISSYSNYTPQYKTTYTPQYTNTVNTSVNNTTSSTTTTDSSTKYSNYLYPDYSANTSSYRSNRSYQTYQNYRQNTSTTQTNQSNQSTSTLKVIPNALTLNQDINDITDGVSVDLFEIGLHNNASGNNSNYKEAIIVDEMTFQIIDNTGAASDLSDFEITIEGESYTFGQNGYLTMRFNNGIRLASGDSKSVPVSIKLEDPNNFPYLSGSLRVRLSDVSAYSELSKEIVTDTLSGSAVSNYVVFNPRIGNNSSAGSATVENITISGQNLGAGQTSYVLGLRLNANGDDFLVKELTVRNIYGNGADNLIDKLNLVDLHTGNILDSTKILNGKAQFTLNNNNDFYIRRNNTGKLGVQVVINDNLQNITDNQIQLSLNSDDIEIYGVGAGSEVPNSRKNIDIDSDTFVITNGGGGNSGIAFSTTQPDLVASGFLNETARFKIGNGGKNEISFGRVTVQTSLSGLEFTGGISSDDLELKLMYNGRAIDAYKFNTTIVDSNTVRFDAESEVYIDGGEVFEFVIATKLTDTSSGSDSEYITFRLLGDSSSAKGTFSSLKSGSSNFLWSDHSGRPHTGTSSDWYNAYLFGDLPSQTYVNRR